MNLTPFFAFFWAANDPVIARGEMIAEYHAYYGSAALMQVNQVHQRVAKKAF